MDATALVRMGSLEEAQAAIQGLDGAVVGLPATHAPAPRAQTSWQQPAISAWTPTQRYPAPQAAPGNAMGLTVRFHGRGDYAPPSDNLYVKGLPGAVSEEEVRGLFESLGQVVSVRIMQPRAPATDATALVRMGSLEEATAAVGALNGGVVAAAPAAQTWPSSPATTWKQAAPAPVQQFGEAQGVSDPRGLEVRFHGPKGSPASDNLYVKGLPGWSGEEEVRALFGQCGTVVSVRIMQPRPPATDAAALVRFSTMEEATVAVSLLHGFGRTAGELDGYGAAKEGHGNFRAAPY